MKVIWLTGLSGSGKTTIANEIKASQVRPEIYILDGDILRTGLCSDLKFSIEDRMENIRRAAEVAKILCDSGKLVIATFITPTEEIRSVARNILGDRYLEVYIKCGLSVCQERDPKGLYEKAMLGLIKDMTGMTSPFDPPENPDVVLNTESDNLMKCISILTKVIQEV